MKSQSKKLLIGILIGAVVTTGIFYAVIQFGKENTKTCSNLPELQDKATKRVTKVIDGDTFIIEGGHSVRLLGIDADENGYPCYEEAKQKLEDLVLNKEVKLIKGANNYDQYCRYLRYPFLDNKNISLQLVKEGLAIARFNPNQKKFKEEIIEAEQKAQQESIGCKWTNPAPSELENTALTWEELTGEVVGSCQAGKYVGEEKTIEGKVVSTYHDEESNTVFLNFNKPYPDHCFNAVIFSSDLHKFVESPEDFYKDKTVRISGEIKKHEDKPQIILKNPNQIEVGQ